jgi:hypothetical protein
LNRTNFVTVISFPSISTPCTLPDISVLLRLSRYVIQALQTTLRFEKEMASRFVAPALPPPPAVGVRDSGRENNQSFPYSSSVARGPETEVRRGRERKGKDEVGRNEGWTGI